MTTDPAPTEAAGRRAALLEGAARSWNELQETVSGLDDRLLAAPGPDGWSIKDHIAHLAHWEQYVLAVIDGRDPMAAMGLEADQEQGEQAVNDALQRLDAGRSPAEARELLADAHAQLMARVEAMSDVDFERSADHVEGNSGSHFDQHRPWIIELAVAASRAGTPE